MGDGQRLVLLGDGQPGGAQLLEALDDLGRVLVGVLQLLDDRDDPLVHELPDGLEDLGLVLGEARRISRSRSHGWGVGDRRRGH
jgi:hypothetical protein